MGKWYLYPLLILVAILVVAALILVNTPPVDVDML